MLDNLLGKSAELKLLIKGKDEKCKGRRYKSSFSVEGFEEHLYSNEDECFTYDFMAKHEASFKKAWATQKEEHQPSLFSSLLSLKRKEFKDEQGSDKWLTNRLLYLTSTSSFEKTTVTRIASARIAKTLASYPSFRELSSEILGDLMDSKGFSSSNMDRGNELEKVALEQFEEEYGVQVDSDVGLLVFNDKEFNVLGSSIDGKCVIDGKKICLEVKAPSYPKFLDKDNYRTYIQQCTIHKIVGGFDEVWVIEYYSGHKLKVNKVDITDTMMNTIIEKAGRINKEVDSLIEEAIDSLVDF